MQVSRSISIKAPKEKVHQIIADYHSWPQWSPWLIAEPDAEVNIQPDGKHYSWLGKIVGAGEMTISEESPGSIKMDLLFLKPFKSKAKVDFVLAEDGDSTQVTWNMDSKLPFFLFWMKKKMQAYIGSDYDRGLKMLQEYAETGTVLSKIEYLGVETLPAIKYVGIHRETDFQGMQKSMGADFESLMTQLSAGNGEWFTLYHKFDMVSGAVHYTACVGVDAYPEEMESDWITAELPEQSVYITRHLGSYDHIGNAWSAAMMQMRAKTFRASKSSSPREIYRNSPQNSAPADLVSDICFVTR